MKVLLFVCPFINVHISILSKPETDDGRRERKSPWPPVMCDEVWTGRVKLRASMKEGMPRYKQVHSAYATLDLLSSLDLGTSRVHSDVPRFFSC